MADDDRPDHSVSRRTMLRRIGAVGAVVWVTPVVTSLNTPAFAASPPTGECIDPAACPGPLNCGPADCSCHPRVDGQGGFCEQDGDCISFGPFCPNGQSDCPSGLVCVLNCCGQICMPPCGGGGGEFRSGAESIAAGKRSNG